MEERLQGGTEEAGEKENKLDRKRGSWVGGEEAGEEERLLGTRRGSCAGEEEAG